MDPDIHLNSAKIISVRLKDKITFGANYLSFYIGIISIAPQGKLIMIAFKSYRNIGKMDDFKAPKIM